MPEMEVRSQEERNPMATEEYRNYHIGTRLKCSHYQQAGRGVATSYIAVYGPRPSL
jgi:hypothetical protein